MSLLVNISKEQTVWTQIRLLLQEKSDLYLHCLSKRLQTFQKTTKAYDFFVICLVRVQCIYGQDIHEMHTRLGGTNNFLTLYQIDST